MNPGNDTGGQKPGRWPPAIIAATTLITIAVSLYCLHYGQVIIFQNLFYVPIVIACMYYTRKGFVFSVVLSFVYLFLMIIYTTGATIFLQASIRVVIFIGIAAVTAFLAERNNAVSTELQQRDQNLEKLVEKRTRELAQTNQKLIAEMAERKLAEDERSLNSSRLQALFRLNQMTDATLKEITDFALEEAVRLTRSTIGYLAFLDENETILTMHSWSKSAMKECAIAEKPIVYPVASTGLWGEAVRQRRPVITNDFLAANPLKKGLPEGHVAIERHMNTPVFDGAHIVIVAGVGNKADGYNNGDVQQLTLLMEGMWKLIARRNADQKVRTLNEQLLVELNERKRAEKERVEIEEHLRVSQKLEAVGTLASGVAHEINNPLNVIMNYAQLILESLSDTVQVKHFSNVIIKESERVAVIVRNLLSFARQDNEAFISAQLSDIVERTVSLMRAVLHKDQIMIQCDVGRDLPEVMCRPQQIQQVLMNLVTNARDALNERPENAGAERAIRVFTSMFEKDGSRWIRLTVEDNGNGIPANVASRVFDPFFTTKGQDKGTGLGLSISYGIVKDHGGDIWFETEPGQGTKFHIDLRLDCSLLNVDQGLPV
jgi:signal transduction histidine kinase